jgi:hypothetical protein
MGGCVGGSDHAEREGDHQSAFAVVVLDGDATDVTFADGLFDLGRQVPAVPSVESQCSAEDVGSSETSGGRLTADCPTLPLRGRGGESDGNEIL